jgi:hypothetical protein
MCVFKYHAFIFLIRPPRWQRETLPSVMLHRNFFLTFFKCHLVCYVKLFSDICILQKGGVIYFSLHCLEIFLSSMPIDKIIYHLAIGMLPQYLYSSLAHCWKIIRFLLCYWALPTYRECLASFNRGRMSHNLIGLSLRMFRWNF